MSEHSESEEEEEGGDAFDMGASMPAFKPDRPPPVAARSGGRRGSVVQVGGKDMALSETAELQVTLRRLREADASGDANIMQAALAAAGPAAMMSGRLAQEVQRIAMDMSARLSRDAGLRRAGALRRSSNVRQRVRRLWDLMGAETAALTVTIGGSPRTPRTPRAPAPEPEAEPLARTDTAVMEEEETQVVRDAYRNMHMRVAKVLAPPGDFDMKEAQALADQDWADDISRFSGTSHITVRLRFGCHS